MENTNEEKNFSVVLGGFFSRTQKFWTVFLILLVVAAVAIGVISTVSAKSKMNGANFLDSEVFKLMKAKSTLEGDELVDAENKFLANVKDFAASNGKNDNTVRAYMMVAETYFKNEDWNNSLESWLKAAENGKSYLSGISYYNAAVCYEQLADTLNAEKYYSLALANADFDLKPHAMFNLARLLESQGKNEQAIAEYKNILNTYSDTEWADLANSRLIIIDTNIVTE